MHSIIICIKVSCYFCIISINDTKEKIRNKNYINTVSSVGFIKLIMFVSCLGPRAYFSDVELIVDDVRAKWYVGHSKNILCLIERLQRYFSHMGTSRLLIKTYK